MTIWIAETERKTLAHTYDLFEDMHKYVPEALEDINDKIDTKNKDTNVGSGTTSRLCRPQR